MRIKTKEDRNLWSVSLICLSLLIGVLFSTSLGATESSDEPNVAISAKIDIAEPLVQDGAQDAVAKLVVTANIRDGLHIYAQTQPKPFLATAISVVDSDAYEIGGEFHPTRSPMVLNHHSIDVELHEFEQSISWEAPIKVRSGADIESLQIEGQVFAQACEQERCFPPETYDFVAVAKGVAPIAQETETANEIATAEQVATTKAIDQTAQTDALEAPSFSIDRLEVSADSGSNLSIWAVLPLAFIAGFILNFMPCVLPVVGLKVLSFVQQADNDRRRIFMLNFSYSLGIVSVLLVLATLAVFAGFGWGEQFSSVGFTVVLASVVFGFALSFLGVWDIRLPGFVGSIQGNEPQEGLSGAFSKGVLSTVLATPCSGPFLGSALAWAVIQPAHLTYIVFGTVGLGMASPFLAIGFFPKLVKWLPKPGNWMKDFKQLMGFVLIATVVFLLSFIKIPAVVPSIALLAAIGLACWWYGQEDLTRSNGSWKRLATSAMIVALSAWWSFGWLYEVSNERFERAAYRHVTAINSQADSGNVTTLVQSEPVTDENQILWQPYSKDRLEAAIAAGKTVFVDFTADWCLTCKANESVAINQPDVAKQFRDDDIVAFRADKTEPAPEVDRLLKQLGNNSASIPFYAVFPKDNPSKPITLDGVFSSPKAFLSAIMSRPARWK